jgi:hypothetical protein
MAISARSRVKRGPASAGGLLALIGWTRRVTMNFFRRMASRFTARGRALAQVDRGMVCANENESDNAIIRYSDVINSSESPRDIQAMALFNRALVYTTIDKEHQATEDLKAVLSMPETMTKIKKSASDKLVRMQRKLKREEAPKIDG